LSDSCGLEAVDTEHGLAESVQTVQNGSQPLLQHRRISCVPARCFAQPPTILPRPNRQGQACGIGASECQARRRQRIRPWALDLLLRHRMHRWRVGEARRRQRISYFGTECVTDILRRSTARGWGGLRRKRWDI